jgi:hypothetical protein
MEVGREGFVLNLRAWMCAGFWDLPASKMPISAKEAERRAASAMKPAGICVVVYGQKAQRDILQRLIGVIGIQESEVDGNGDWRMPQSTATRPVQGSRETAKSRFL